MHAITSAGFAVRTSPLLMDFAISKGTMTIAESVFIELTGTMGVSGLGEAAPFPVLTGDNLQLVCQFCEQFLPTLEGLSPEKALHLVHGAWRDDLFNQSPTFLTGVETALYDLIAKYQKIPLAWLWGREPLAGVRTDMTLPVIAAKDVGLFWSTYGHYGFQEIKVKVGSPDIRDDVERIEAMIRLAPELERISLDGNQAFDVSRAMTLMKELAKRGIEPALFEQPLPKNDFLGMKELKDRSTIPIFADESVVTTEDAKRVIAERAAHGINLKIMKSGIKESLDIARLANAAGLKLMIGGMLETEVAMTTSLHLACGSKLIDWHDLDTPFFIEDRATSASPYHDNQAYLALPVGMGHGLNLMPQDDSVDRANRFLSNTLPVEHPYRMIEKI